MGAFDYDEESMMLEDSVTPTKATFIQHNKIRSTRPETGSVAIPAVFRPAGQGKKIKVSKVNMH